MKISQIKLIRKEYEHKDKRIVELCNELMELKLDKIIQVVKVEEKK